MSKRFSRSQARCEAFKLIFELNQHKDDIDFLFEHLTEEKPECIGSLSYIKNVVLGVLEHDEELCEIISKSLAAGWRLERLSKAAKAVLKLAVFEMKYVEDVPEKVAINEALELIKKFDEPESAAFINGVLAGVLADNSIGASKV